jgi:Cdc6-like AAA superfamily ATPase
MNRNFANYHSERAAFSHLFAGGCDKRILLFKGDSGSGKSSLLRACLNEHKSAKPVAIELRESKVGVEGILSSSASAIGRENLPRYNQCVQDMATQKQQIYVSNFTQKGEANSLTVTLNEKNQLAANEQRHMTLTEAWFEDVKVLGT